MVVFTLIIGLVLAIGWASAELNYRSVKTKNKVLGDRQKRLVRQIEEMHMLLNNGQSRIEELEELSSSANEYKMQAEKLSSDVSGLKKECGRMKEAFAMLKERAGSKEYFGNSLGKVIIATIDGIMEPEENKERLSDSAKSVFRRAQRAMTG